MANPKKKTKKKKKNPIFPMPPGPMWLGKGADATLEEKLARKMGGKAPRRFSPRIEKEMGRLAVDQATKFYQTGKKPPRPGGRAGLAHDFIFSEFEDVIKAKTKPRKTTKHSAVIRSKTAKKKKAAPKKKPTPKPKKQSTLKRIGKGFGRTLKSLRPSGVEVAAALAWTMGESMAESHRKSGKKTALQKVRARTRKSAKAGKPRYGSWTKAVKADRDWEP